MLSQGAALPPYQQQGTRRAVTGKISNSIPSPSITDSAASWICEAWLEKQQKIPPWHLILCALSPCLRHSRSTSDNTGLIDSTLSWAALPLFPGWRTGATSYCPVRSHRAQGTAWGRGNGTGKIHGLETFKKTAGSTWSMVALET